LEKNNLQDQALSMFSSLLEKSRLSNELFSYYCSRIYNETKEMYETFNSSVDFAEDLFIEQSKRENFNSTKLFNTIIRF
jgi:hypothetical protein